VRRFGHRVLLALLVATGGCSSRAHFSYPHLTGGSHQGGLVGGLQDVCDRLVDRHMMEFYDEDIPTAITNALAGEMQETGLFTRVDSLPGCAALPSLGALRERGIDIAVQPQLERMEWEVPGYAEILGTMLVVGVATGGLGGMIYGSTDTDVYGRVTLRMALLDVRTGQTLDRVYSGEAHDKVQKLSSDNGTTRRDMVGRAFNNAMKSFRADLAAMASALPPTPIP